MMFALGTLILAVSANKICVRHADSNSCSMTDVTNDCFMMAKCYADATCDCMQGGGVEIDNSATITVDNNRLCVRHRDDNSCTMELVTDHCLSSGDCYADPTYCGADCSGGGGGGGNSESSEETEEFGFEDCTDAVMDDCLAKDIKNGLCDVLEYEDLIGMDMSEAMDDMDDISVDASMDGSMEDAMDDFNDAMDGLEDALEDVMKEALERAEDGKKMTKILEKVEKKQSDLCEYCHDHNDNTDLLSELWEKCEDEVKWEYAQHKTGAKCDATVLTSNDCGGSCQMSDCERLCTGRCKYFAHWENGKCETYDACDTTTSENLSGTVSIYKKSATKKSSSDDDNTGLIVGVVVGVLVGCVLLAVGVFCCMKKSKTVD